MLRHKLSGVGAAMITPFTADGRVDYKALARMIDYVIEGGVDYIVALGTTAETPTLYMPERAVIAMFITNHIAGRVPLVMVDKDEAGGSVRPQTAAQCLPVLRRRMGEGTDMIPCGPVRGRSRRPADGAG